jgi:hypothetical protein
MVQGLVSEFVTTQPWNEATQTGNVWKSGMIERYESYALHRDQLGQKTPKQAEPTLFDDLEELLEAMDAKAAEPDVSTMVRFVICYDACLYTLIAALASRTGDITWVRAAQVCFTPWGLRLTNTFGKTIRNCGNKAVDVYHNVNLRLCGVRRFVDLLVMASELGICLTSSVPGREVGKGASFLFRKLDKGAKSDALLDWEAAERTWRRRYESLSRATAEGRSSKYSRMTLDAQRLALNSRLAHGLKKARVWGVKPQQATQSSLQRRYNKHRAEAGMTPGRLAGIRPGAAVEAELRKLADKDVCSHVGWKQDEMRAHYASSRLVMGERRELGLPGGPAAVAEGLAGPASGQAPLWRARNEGEDFVSCYEPPSDQRRMHQGRQGFLALDPHRPAPGGDAAG